MINEGTKGSRLAAVGGAAEHAQARSAARSYWVWALAGRVLLFIGGDAARIIFGRAFGPGWDRAYGKLYVPAGFM